MNNVDITAGLRRAARDIFLRALRAVDPRVAITASVTFAGEQLRIHEHSVKTENRKIYSVAIGKAAAAMASGLEVVIGDRLNAGVLTGPPLRDETLDLSRWQVFAGGHPVPNQSSLDAARAALALLERANTERAVVVFLISGGGSAMLEWPRSANISLTDLQETNRTLTTCGASISEINSVRAAFSAVKAGELARIAPNSEQISLIVSDTNPGDEASVASGPTFARSSAGANTRQVLERYNLNSSLPRSILECVRSYEPSPVALNFPHFVLASNETALEAAAEMARKLGFATAIAGDIREQPIEDGCRLLIDRLVALTGSATGSVCLIAGGEFSSPVRGDGTGGRNLETVLRCAIELEKRGLPAVVLSAGTDGIDGNSPAAGAIADQLTVKRAVDLGLNPDQFLDQSDSFAFFNRLGDTIMTGPTGTNVRDLRILLLKE